MFSYKSALLRHIKNIHDGQRNFKCAVCGKQFAQNCDLRRHARIHTGEKPYKCEICGRPFCQKYGLRIHLANVHSDTSHGTD